MELKVCTSWGVMNSATKRPKQIPIKPVPVFLSFWVSIGVSGFRMESFQVYRGLGGLRIEDLGGFLPRWGGGGG